MIQSNPVSHTLDKYIQVSSYFQRAIHLRYDLDNPEAIHRYVPTKSAAEAIASIVAGTKLTASQRAHVFHAAYGSGKSLLAVSVAGLLERHPASLGAIQALTNRLEIVHGNAGQQVRNFLEEQHVRLLPVVLVGDEGDIEIALPRALARSLKREGAEIALSTRFNAALETIELWRNHYPDTFTELAYHVESVGGESIDAFEQRLKSHDELAYHIFERVYTDLTAGAIFDPSYRQNIEELFRGAASSLVDYGYDGIVIIWDEFGRYLEARSAKAFGNEAAQLQNLAEICNYSGENQIHLLLFAHKELQSYSAGLPKSYQQEWARIEGRFQRHDVTSDSQTAYELLASAFKCDDHILKSGLNESHLNMLVARSLDMHLFGFLESGDTRSLISRTWPLHPLTVFALAKLSNRVAQNERTMFTFLTTDERYSFRSILTQMNVDLDDLSIRPHHLWDYFQDAIRADSGPGGAHGIWSGLIHALDKVPKHDQFTQEVVKTLGVLLIVSESGTARPDTDLLCWAMGADTENERAAVVQALENLRRRKVVIHRESDGYWNFIAGSDIDFEKRIVEVLERTNPSEAQLRRQLEKVIPPPYTVARRYNQDHEMTRFFTGLYRWPSETNRVPWEKQIENLDNADGIVVYVLAVDELSIEHAYSNIPNNPRIVFAIPEEPLTSLQHALRELFGLYELSNDPLLKSQEDRERIQRELNWLVEDTEERLRRIVKTLIDPHSGQARWCQSDYQELITNPGRATRLVSDICRRVFHATPVIINEGVNKRYPTKQQTRASEKVIDALFAHPPADQLGLSGRGPEILVCNTLLTNTGILREKNGEWLIERPTSNPKLLQIWDHIDSFIQTCQQEGPQGIALLIESLTAPPYGLRQGVIPVLLAAVLRNRLKATTIRQGQRALHPVNGALLTDMVYNPSSYTLEVGEWNDSLERMWQALESTLASYSHDSDRNQEPLAMIKTAMIRWLQNLPRFCRDTMQLGAAELEFRSLIRKAQLEPTAVILHDLPELVGAYESSDGADIENRLDSLMSAIGAAYLELQRRLDRFAVEHFALATPGLRHDDGLSAIRSWLAEIETNVGRPITEFRFGSPTTQAFVDTVVNTQEDSELFWDQLAFSVTGLHLRDWIDKSEENFYANLLDARSDIELETQALIGNERSAVAIAVQLPGNAPKDYRFRSVELTKHGKSVLQNLRSTIDIAGRPLSVDEKRLIAVELLRYILGDNHDQ